MGTSFELTCWRITKDFVLGMRRTADARMLSLTSWSTCSTASRGSSKSNPPIVSIDRRGLVKVNPIAAMSDADNDAYVAEHGVIVNPLQFEGYGSIGCWPCTEPSVDGRAGRWADSGKTECGLHL